MKVKYSRRGFYDTFLCERVCERSLEKKLKKKLVELQNAGMGYHYCFPTFVCLELYTVSILKNQCLLVFLKALKDISDHPLSF